MTSPVKGFRKAKDPNKKQVINENDKLRQALEALHAGQKFTMQQLMRMTQDVQHQVREVGAITNLIGMSQLGDDAVLANGDVAIINFAGTLEDGSMLDNGSGRKTAIRLGSDSFIPGFEAGLLGAKIGDTLDLALTFPESYGVKELANVKVNFRVQIVDALRNRVDTSAFDSYVAELEAKKAAAAKAEAGAKNDNEKQEASAAKEENQEQAQA